MFLLHSVLTVYSQECRKSHNFSSMSAIVAALQSIPQLILTRETKLTKSEKRLLSQLHEILAPQGDHQAYREALQSSESPFIVPWLGAHSPSLALSSAETLITCFPRFFPRVRASSPKQRSTYACCKPSTSAPAQRS